MFGWIVDLYMAAAALCAPEIGFGLAWKRARHHRYGHNTDKSKLVEEFKSLHHPQNDAKLQFYVRLKECECGIVYVDSGWTFSEEYNKRLFPHTYKG